MKKLIIISAAVMFFLLPLEGKNNNEAVYNTVSKSYILNKDGSQELRVVKEITLFTHTAMNRTYGETFIPFSPEFQTLVINESYTKQVDGTIVKTPSNAFVECLRSFASEAPAYNGEREMVVVHTGLELGATIYLDYTITTKAGYFAGIDLFEIPRETSPVKKYSLSVSVPEGTPLRYSSLNADFSPKITRSDNQTTAKWSLKNLPALSRESGVSIQSGGIPVISVVSFDSTLYTFSGFKVAERGVNIDIPIIKGEDQKETVTLIKKYISENFYLVPAHNLSDTKFLIRNLNDIISSAYGNEIELTYLMNQMLMSAGITSEFVARYPFKMELNSPFGISSISDFMVTTPVKGEELVSVRLSSEELIGFDSEYSTFMTVNQNPATVTIPPKDINIDITKDIDILEGDLKTVSSDYCLFTLPKEDRSISAKGYDKYGSTRKNNILLPGRINEHYIYNITFDGSLKLSGKGRNVEITNNIGSVKITTSSDGDRVTVEKSLSITKRLITPADYQAFRALMVEWGDKNGDKVLFVKK